ncbi:MAG TPA: hydroxyethylthiazole kinase [Porphyromonadaceae bacterium]|nr:hydroxyethylthiazole kinase [Porphyromonadaceae bacterium]
MINLEEFENECSLIREQTPLIHNITNYPAMNFTANVLLALGASPLMSFAEEEMEEIVSRCNALVVNIGCIDRFQIKSIEHAVQTASSLGKRWVFDPVGIGISKLRSEFSTRLITQYQPSVIRGNASEILFLAGENVEGRGVDSLCESSMAIEKAQHLAHSTGSIVAVSGKVDYITDGNRVCEIHNGDPIMGSVTAMGCASTAVIGAFLSVSVDAFQATTHAVALMGLAGEKSAQNSKGAGSFVVNFLDTLYNFNPKEDGKFMRA